MRQETKQHTRNHSDSMGTRGMSETGLKLSWANATRYGKYFRISRNYFPIISQSILQLFPDYFPKKIVIQLYRPIESAPPQASHRQPTDQLFLFLPQHQHRQEPKKPKILQKLKNIVVFYSFFVAYAPPAPPFYGAGGGRFQ